MKDLYIENYKTLLKKFKDNTDKWKDILYPWTRGLNIVKMSVLPRVIYRFSANFIKIPMVFFCKNRRGKKS